MKSVQHTDDDALRSLVLRGHINMVLNVVWSPCCRYVLSSSTDRTARVWLASTGKCLKVLEGHTDRVWNAAWSPCSKYIVTGSSDKTARVWRLDVSKDISEDGTPKASECLQVLKGHAGWVTRVAWSPCGQYVLTNSGDDATRVWRLDVSNYVSKKGVSSGTSKNGVCLKVLQGHTDSVTHVAWSSCSNYLATSSLDKTARVWRLDVSHDVSDDGTSKNGECLQVLEGHSDWTLCVAWSPLLADGSSMLATGLHDGTVRVWRLDVSRDVSNDTCKQHECLHVLKGHTDAILSMAWSPLLADGSCCMLATGSWDCTARVWRFDESKDMSDDGTSKDGECLQVLEGHTGGITCIAWAFAAPQVLADNSTTMLVTGSWDMTIRVWRATTGEQIHVLHVHDAVFSVAWSPCSQYVVTGLREQTARVWRFGISNDISKDSSNSASKDGGCVSVMRGHTSLVLSVAWSSCSKYIVTGSRDGTVRVWRFDSSNGTSQDAVCLNVFKGPSDLIRGVTWPPTTSSNLMYCLWTGSCGDYDDNITCIMTVCKWTPRTHCRFPPAARLLVRRVMCARDRLTAALGAANAYKTSLPLEIWLLIFEIIFRI